MGRTILDIAKATGDVELVRLLKNAGAQQVMPHYRTTAVLHKNGHLHKKATYLHKKPPLTA